MKKIKLCLVSFLAFFVLSTTTALASPPVEKYPKNWTWEKEKKKIYPNGSGRPPWMPKIWFAIAACEQPYGNHRVQWNASSSGYVTGFGFARSTWSGYKLPGYPSDGTKASTWQMYQVALAVYRDFRWTGWGCWKNGDYKYHL